MWPNAKKSTHIPTVFFIVAATTIFCGTATSRSDDVPFNLTTIDDLIWVLRDRYLANDTFQLDEKLFNEPYSNISSFNVSSRMDITETQCLGQINAGLRALAKGDLWALKMFDSWGKMPSGILSGNLYELGDYDTCLTIRHDNDDSTSSIGDIQGQYCLAQLYADPDSQQTSSVISSLLSSGRLLHQPMPNIDAPIRLKGMDAEMLARALPPSGLTTPNSLSLMVALCMPTKCSPEMVSRAFAVVAQMFRIPLVASVTAQMCSRAAGPDEPASQLSALDLAAIVFFAFVAATMIMSTMYDLYMTFYSKDAPKTSVLYAFSVYTNGHKLFQLQPNADAAAAAAPQSNATVMQPQLQCLNGIRALSIVWVVLGHTYMVMAVAPLINAAHILEWIELPRSVFLMTALVAVDTFFMMSGLLVARALLSRLDRCGGIVRLNVPMLYVHRYMRLTPPLAAVVLLSVSLLRRFGDGPLWSTFLTAADVPCRRWWWTTLLYVQNYVNPREMCLGYTWYLSVDTQLYVLAPLLVWPLWWLAKRRRTWLRRTWLLVLPTLAFASMATTFVLFVTNHLSSRILTNLLGGKRMELTYYPTHTRAGAWLIGVMLAFAMHERRGRNVIIAKYICTLGWTLCVGTVIAVLAGNYPLQSSAYPDSPWAGGAYEALSRVTWAAAVAWLVFACAHGYGGPVNWWLSLPGWQPLARLSYTIYLVHLPVQVVLVAQRRVPGYFNDLYGVAAFWSAFGVTLMVAVLWTLAFESPVLSLERALRATGSQRRRNRGDGEQQRAQQGENVNEASVRSADATATSYSWTRRGAIVGSSREELVWTMQQQQQQTPR